MKITENDYHRLFECGARPLFDYDLGDTTYRLLDGYDAQDNENYIIIAFDDEDGKIKRHYQITLKEAYDILALYWKCQCGEVRYSILDENILKAIEA